MRRWLMVLTAAWVVTGWAGLAAADPAPDETVYKDKELDRVPAWDKKPSPGELRAVFPTKALKAGIGGKATIECEVATDGLLRKCVILKEEPAGMDFGGAALALTPQLRFKPGMKNGHPVVSKVVIPINWEGTGAGTGSRVPFTDDLGPAIVTNPHWAAAPTHADVRAAYPKGRTDAGSVTLICYLRPDGSLRDCTTDKGGAFSSAARSLAPKFHVDVAGVDPKRLHNIEVQVAVHFDHAGLNDDVTGARIVNAPNWTQLPGMDDFKTIFPKAALAKGIKVGKGTVSCVVGANGGLGACRLLSEDPPGLGFGDAALKLAATFRLNPWTDDGHPVDGAVINIPIKLVYPDDAPPDQPAPKS
jgi:TonB family protein